MIEQLKELQDSFLFLLQQAKTVILYTNTVEQELGSL